MQRAAVGAVLAGFAAGAGAAVVTLEIVADTADGSYSDLATPFLDGGRVGFRAESAVTSAWSIVVDAETLVTEGSMVDSAVIAIPGFTAVDGDTMSLIIGDDCCGGGTTYASHYLFSGSSGQRVVDRDTPIDGFSNPLNLSNSPFDPTVGVSSVEGGSLAFFLDSTHTVPYDQDAALLLRDPGGAITVLADTTTAMPDSGGTLFTGFAPPVFEGGQVAFRGRGSGRGGIYTWSNDSLSRVVDSTTPAPGFEPTPFGDSFAPGIARDGTDTAFVTTGLPEGVFKVVGGTPLRVTDTASGIPGGVGNFFDFRQVDIHHGKVAFVGLRDNQFAPPLQYGVYTDLNGPLEKVVDLSDVIAGRTPKRFDMMTGFGLSGRRILFVVQFTDDSKAVGLATVYPAGTDPGILFGDDFESGDTDFWSFAAP